MLYVCVCVYIYIYTVYIINIHSPHICKQELLFWMRLIAINRLTALINIQKINTTKNGLP